MKKLIILFGLILFSPALAADDQPTSSSYCIQVMTPAVSPNGVCQEFSTPCDVPEGWRSLPSCDLIKPADQGTDFRDLVDKRRKMRAETLRKKAKLQKPSRKGKRSGRLRIGKTSFIKKVDNHSRSTVDEKKRDSFFNKRATSRSASYGNKEAYTRYKERSANKEAFKKGLTRVEKYKLEQKKRGIKPRPGRITSTQMNREGYLSSKSFWGQRAMKSDPGPVRVWKKFQAQKRIKVKHKRTNRSGWRGERLEGDLD